MRKRTNLAIELRPRESEPVFLALCRSIIDDIERGRLKPGDPLPGTRALAKSVHVNRNTVDAAYQELIGQGWLQAEPSSGTFVAHDLPRFGRRKASRTPKPDETTPSSSTGTHTVQISDGMPDPRLLPVAALARSFKRAMASLVFLSGSDRDGPKGSARLREQLARHLRDERGLSTGSERIVVARGSQMVLYLAAAAAVAKGDVIAVETPGYPLAWRAFREAGARVIGVPVDDGGMDLDALEQLAGTEPALKAVYVTPHHQYPTTVTLGMARRLRLLDLARRFGLILIEDDYDAEYRFDGRPLLPMAGRVLDEGPTTIYVGSLSKLLAPGIRLGYACAPRALIERMADRRLAMDRRGDQILEEAIADALADGTLYRHARKARRVYQERRDSFAGLVRERLPDVLSFSLPAGGLAIWTRVIAEYSAQDWAESALKNGLQVSSGATFCAPGDAPRQALRLGFANLTYEEMKVALSILVASLPERTAA